MLWNFPEIAALNASLTDLIYLEVDLLLIFLPAWRWTRSLCLLTVSHQTLKIGMFKLFWGDLSWFIKKSGIFKVKKVNCTHRTMIMSLNTHTWHKGSTLWSLASRMPSQHTKLTSLCSEICKLSSWTISKMCRINKLHQPLFNYNYISKPVNI